MPIIAGQDMRTALACLAEWFPQAFTLEPYLPNRPLKVGIGHDILVRCPALTARERCAVLHQYVSRVMYLRACVAGAARVDLDGNACGEVTAEEAQYANSAQADPARATGSS